MLLESYLPVMFGHGKGRNGFASSLSATACVGLALAALCLAHEAQVPLKSYADSGLKWEKCGEVNNHTLECSRLLVPMDHSNPSSDKTFSLPVLRVLGKNASASGDRHVFFNPGGPGGSGVDFLRKHAVDLHKVLGDDFHLLSFDPRGVHRSIPQAVCYASPAQRAVEFATNPWDMEFQAGKMYTRAENKAKACEDIMGEHGRFVNTPQTAADMNSILDALGQPSMYYWGFSYGTTLGQTYAQMFPDRVARLVIDGVSNLDQWYESFYFEESLVDTDRSFAGFVDECVKAKHACPLNSLDDGAAATLQSRLDAVLRRLERDPVPVYVNSTRYGAVTRRSVVTNGIFPALYKPTAWPELAANLAALLAGNATPAFESYTESWVLDMLVDDSTLFVIQNDNLRTGPDAPVHGIRPVLNRTLGRPEVSHLVSKYEASDVYDRASWSMPTTHRFRPRYHPAHPRVRTAEPILVLSTTWDPVCPLASAKKARDSFEGARLLEQRSFGHCTISMPSLCTAKHVRRYFNHGLLPDDGATCGIDADYFPAGRASAASGLSAEEEELLRSLDTLATTSILLARGHM